MFQKILIILSILFFLGFFNQAKSIVYPDKQCYHTGEYIGTVEWYKSCQWLHDEIESYTLNHCTSSLRKRPGAPLFWKSGFVDVFSTISTDVGCDAKVTVNSHPDTCIVEEGGGGSSPFL